MFKCLAIIIFSIFSSISCLSQDWAKFNEINENPTLFDYQNKFNDHWEGKNIKNGYYTNLEGLKVKAYGWKQFKRWENYWTTRVNPTTGEFPDSTQWNKALGQSERPLNQDRTGNGFTGSWENYGPYYSTDNMYGVGRINCIEFHPTNVNVFWVGTPSGGLWKTSNGGSSWEVLTDNNSLLGVSSIAIPSDYATSKVMYIATGDRDATDNMSIGVLKSINNGITWHATGLSFNPADNERVNKISISPSNTNKLFAATTNGFFVSDDAGATWTNTTNENFIDFELNPTNPNIIYGATRTSSKIFISLDAGQTWSLANTFTGGGRIELTVSENDASIVYAVVIDNTSESLQGIYKSTDSGNTYNMVFDGSLANQNLLGFEHDGSDAFGQGSYDLALEANPNNVNEVYLGGLISWKTIDGGTTWTVANDVDGIYGAEYVHVDKHYFKFNNNEIYECNDGGLYKSSNDGVNWTVISDGIKHGQMYRLGLSKTNENLLLTGQQDCGTKQINSNSNWEDVSVGDGMECIITANDKYASWQGGNVMRLSDWTDISANVPGGAFGDWTTPLLVDPNDPNTLYIGYWDVYKTADKGDTWTALTTFIFDDFLIAMAISNSNTNYMYTSTDSKLWKSTNGGTVWTNITATLPVSQSKITYISIKDNDPNTIWVSMGAFNSNNVFQSTDGGSTWTDISAGIPDISVNTVIQNKLVTDEIQLFAGTDFGVYVKNGTADWELFSTNMPKVVVTELEIFYNLVTPSNSLLYASTFGRGVWRSKLQCDDLIEITAQSGTNVQNLNENIIFSVSMTGNVVSYQWKKDNINLTNGGNISGVNTSTLTINNITMADYGTYNCEIIGGCNTLTSNYADLFMYTGIEKLKEIGINVYPNPSGGVFNIEILNSLIGVDYNISDINGKIVFKSILDSSISHIDISEFPKGTYKLTVNVKGKPTSTLIILY